MVSRWVQWKNDCQISKTGQRLGQNQSANNQKGLVSGMNVRTDRNEGQDKER